MFNKSDCVKAIKSGWRRDTTHRGGRQKAGQLRKLALWLRSGASERLSVAYDSTVPTACWNNDGGIHSIKLGLSAFSEADFHAKVVGDSRRMLGFAKAVLRHEACHARYSNDPGMLPADVGAFCDSLGVPFRIWNLFEDCFIEMKRFTDTKRRFGWHNYLKQTTETTSASSMLYALKTSEAGSKSGWSAYLPKWKGSASDVHYKGKWISVQKCVIDFYKRALDGNAFERVELAKEWILLFGDEVPTEYKDGGCSGGAGSGGKDSYKSKGPHKESGKDGWTTGERVSEGSRVQRDRIARSMGSLIQNAEYEASRISEAGSRLHMRNAMIGASGSFRSCEEADGKRSIVLIVDHSTSMARDWERLGGKEFVSAWQRLNELGIAEVKIIYSSWDSRKMMRDRPADKILSDAPASGGEGIQRCVAEYKKEILESDVTIVYTDGAITDGDIDLKPFRASTQIIGACIVPEGASYARRMAEWFDAVALRGSAEGLATCIARLITRS